MQEKWCNLQISFLKDFVYLSQIEMHSRWPFIELHVSLQNAIIFV